MTGGFGFIGANFIHYLLKETDFPGRIVNVDKLTYAGNPENLEKIEEQFPDRYHFIKADICDRESMADIFEKFGIDTVCHFAAESHVDRSIVRPDAFIRTNIDGTFNLLEIAKMRKDRMVLFHHVSTDEVYGTLGESGFFKEDTPYRPNSPYAASKAASDHLVRAYSKTYDLPVTISNCSNNYGPFQFPEKLMPLMILNALEGKQLPVYGDGGHIRDWLYVRDHCRAVWMIMKNGKRGGTYNIGGRCEMHNIDVVNSVCDLLDEILPLPDGRHRRNLIRFIKDRPGHDRRYAIDCSKLEKELQWAPEESFETGLQKTIRWYIENRGWIERIKSGAYTEWIKTHYEGI